MKIIDLKVNKNKLVKVVWNRKHGFQEHVNWEVII